LWFGFPKRSSKTLSPDGEISHQIALFQGVRTFTKPASSEATTNARRISNGFELRQPGFCRTDAQSLMRSLFMHISRCR
jgi:hypothetical protein